MVSRGYIFHDFEGKKKFPFKDDEFIRMWVADMEFAMCPDVIQAIKDRADKRIIGYSQVFESSFFEAYNDWNEKMYSWRYPREEICFSLGIIPSLYKLTSLLLGEEDCCILNTPAYGYFQHPIDYNHKHVIQINSYGQKMVPWSIDFDALNVTLQSLLLKYSFGVILITRQAVSGPKRNCAKSLLLWKNITFGLSVMKFTAT